MSTSEILALLCGEPWYFTPQEAAKLTLFQIRHILLAPRDDKGQLIIHSKSDRLTNEERFFKVSLRRNIPRWRIAELWTETLEKAAGEKVKKPQRQGRPRRG